MIRTLVPVEALRCLDARYLQLSDVNTPASVEIGNACTYQPRRIGVADINNNMFGLRNGRAWAPLAVFFLSVHPHANR